MVLICNIMIGVGHTGGVTAWRLAPKLIAWHGAVWCNGAQALLTSGEGAYDVVIIASGRHALPDSWRLPRSLGVSVRDSQCALILQFTLRKAAQGRDTGVTKASRSQIITSLPIFRFKMVQNLDLRCVLLSNPSPVVGTEGQTQTTCRIQNKYKKNKEVQSLFSARRGI